MCGRFSKPRIQVNMYLVIHQGKERRMRTSQNNGMTRLSLVESFMVMVFIMLVRVWTKDNDGVKCYPHGYAFTVLMVIIDNLYYGRSIDERSTSTK